MRRLRDRDLVDVIRRLEQPVLGICLGMQLLAEASEEEDVECLSIVPGIVRKLSGDAHCPVPNMGWCPVTVTTTHPILPDSGQSEWFYFLHSYALPVSEHTIATADHAASFSAMIARNNFVAAQFHPERSSSAGARLLRDFLGETA